MMKILVLDNYDSFTYNLVQMIEQIVGTPVTVAKNNTIDLQDINAFDKIILSPGPGIPKDAGILLELIQYYSGKRPILGVCLGLQAIVEAYGGKIMNLPQIYHGVATDAIQVTRHRLLEHLPQSISVGRYHSWAADREDFPDDLIVTSVDPDGIIMSIVHRTYNLHAVQYHPESILTPAGRTILKNFLLN